MRILFLLNVIFSAVWIFFGFIFLINPKRSNKVTDKLYHWIPRTYGKFAILLTRIVGILMIIFGFWASYNIFIHLIELVAL